MSVVDCVNKVLKGLYKVVWSCGVYYFWMYFFNFGCGMDQLLSGL